MVPSGTPYDTALLRQHAKMQINCILSKFFMPRHIETSLTPGMSGVRLVSISDMSLLKFPSKG